MKPRRLMSSMSSGPPSSTISPLMRTWTLSTLSFSRIASVVAGGPADQAGIKGGTQPTAVQGLTTGGDLIIAVDGIEIKDFSELMSYLVLNASVGDDIVLTIIRSGKTMDVTVTLGQRQ